MFKKRVKASLWLGVLNLVLSMYPSVTCLRSEIRLIQKLALWLQAPGGTISRSTCLLNSIGLRSQLERWEYLSLLIIVTEVCARQTTGGPHKWRVWLFVRNIKKCVGEYWRVLYRKLISRNGRVKAQNKCKPTSIVVYCRFCGSTWRIWAIFTFILSFNSTIPRYKFAI